MKESTHDGHIFKLDMVLNMYYYYNSFFIIPEEFISKKSEKS